MFISCFDLVRTRNRLVRAISDPGPSGLLSLASSKSHLRYMASSSRMASFDYNVHLNVDEHAAARSLGLNADIYSTSAIMSNKAIWPWSRQAIKYSTLRSMAGHRFVPFWLWPSGSSCRKRSGVARCLLSNKFSTRGTSMSIPPHPPAKEASPQNDPLVAASEIPYSEPRS